ncbi:Acetyltransferase (GNAT) domain-containing protein [Luteibacter sp. UNC138MFCol5.1]|uniref:GNAT family N-acetyltransferase n=1 Tax=Luteibacter sp. UNC138MFCol5.1 TaxID=1502774 RepID=UPI0008B80285|nr:GNAT family N-acetyltransferase [Luteibacter sp. UNC138MFCol5.1]SEO32056.1 Acetyltransferase (GNAT) domain-containing protein [Luteibacter sp. UNC138MFCol5.1]
MSNTSAATTDKPPAFASINGDHWIETLLDGSHVLIRPLQPEDREREAAFIRRLSPEAKRCRFLGELREASKELLDNLMEVDYVHAMAFVALVHDDGELREVGVSRYAASDDGTRCECAVTVADDWRHRGLAVALMRHLISVARSKGFKTMYSIDLAENGEMEELARYLGFTRMRDPEDATLVMHSLRL